MPAFAEVFLAHLTTTATYLAGVLRVHKQHLSTSIFSFVGTELLEHAPTSIDNTFVQPGFPRHSVWEILPVLILFRLGALAHVRGLQLLKDNRSIDIHEHAALFVQEITALVRYLPMCSGNLFDRFLSAMGAPFLARESLLQAF